MHVWLISTLLTATCFGQSLEGTSGTWKMNAARSTFAGGAPFKSLTIRIERHPKGEVFTLDRIETNGLAQVGADPGWTFQNPQAGGNALRAVAALDLKTMIAVGEQGSILRTTDTGVTWKSVSSGMSAALSGVSFADANTGIAVGSDGF